MTTPETVAHDAVLLPCPFCGGDCVGIVRRHHVHDGFPATAPATQGDAEPVYQIWECIKGSVYWQDCSRERYERRLGSSRRIVYAAPQPTSDDALDAARYRLLRDMPDDVETFETKLWGWTLKQGASLDTAIDAAIARQAAGGVE